MKIEDSSNFYRLMYQSRSTLAGEEQLQIQANKDILRQSRHRNIRHGVSGILLFNQLEYFQVLEGCKAAVELIFKDIVRDARHVDVITLQRGPADCRIFHSWSMAYKEFLQGAGYLEYPLEQFPAKLLSDGLNAIPGCLAAQTATSPRAALLHGPGIRAQ
jgi:hypothetical protein